MTVKRTLGVLWAAWLVLFGTSSPVFAAPAALTPAERAYVAAVGPITMCVDPDWEPFEKIDAYGRHVGIAADLVQLAAKNVGISIELMPTVDWDASIAASQAGRCKILSFLNQTPRRDEWLIFTRPLFFDYNVFITREEHPPIADPAKLNGATVVFPKGTAMEERIRRDYPNLTVMTADSEREAVALVSERKADMTMRSLIMAAYTIKKDGWFNLKIAGQLPDYENRLRIGVVKSEPVLRDVLDKGAAMIANTQRDEIVNRYVSVKMETPLDGRLLAIVAAGVAGLIGGGGLMIWRLRRRSRRLEELSQTDGLTGLSNRNKIHEDYRREFERCRRYGRPLSVMVLDIDNFKQVNDELGHVVGDSIIAETARAIRAGIRTGDSVGRWGGEEFLLICPETEAGDAAAVANRVCNAVRCGVYDSGRRHSVSVGVAALRPDDAAETLLKRADEAMYLAKRAGRDRVNVL